jgi:hypothetical protein
MKIDNRILLPFALPFVLLGVTRLMWFVAGAEWAHPEVAATICMLGGICLGGIIMGALFDGEKSIGHITIGRRHD